VKHKDGILDRLQQGEPPDQVGRRTRRPTPPDDGVGIGRLAYQLDLPWYPRPPDDMVRPGLDDELILLALADRITSEAGRTRDSRKKVVSHLCRTSSGYRVLWRIDRAPGESRAVGQTPHLEALGSQVGRSDRGPCHEQVRVKAAVRRGIAESRRRRPASNQNGNRRRIVEWRHRSGRVASGGEQGPAEAEREVAERSPHHRNSNPNDGTIGSENDSIASSLS
jgi:hypothetical protein